MTYGTSFFTTPSQLRSSKLSSSASYVFLLEREIYGLKKVLLLKARILTRAFFCKLFQNKRDFGRIQCAITNKPYFYSTKVGRCRNIVRIPFRRTYINISRISKFCSISIFKTLKTLAFKARMLTRTFSKLSQLAKQQQHFTGAIRIPL